MFWGLVLEPSKSYAQIVDTPFHVSMAALDLKHADNSEEASTLILRQDDTEYVLANLSKKHKIFNINLGLDFDIGEEIEFFVQGQSQIHLTGFLAGDDDEEELEDLNEEDEEDVEEKIEAIKKAEAAKRKLKGADKSAGPVKKQKILDESFNDETDEDDFDVDENDFSDLEDEEDTDDLEEEDEDDSDDEEEQVAPPKKQQQKPQQQQQPKQGVQGAVESKKQKKKQKQLEKQQQNKQPNQQQQKNQNQNKTPQKNQQAVKTPQKTPQVKTPQPNKQNAKSPQGNGEATKSPAKPQRKVLKGGLIVEDIAEGTGKVASSNKKVGVHYVGRLASSKKVFDKTSGGKPFDFILGRGEVIRGWDLGVEGMREGGKRKLIIPAKFGYGSSGAPPAIPPNSTLEFEVSLVNVK